MVRLSESKPVERNWMPQLGNEPKFLVPGFTDSNILKHGVLWSLRVGLL
jgi:hypothetical protein